MVTELISFPIWKFETFPAIPPNVCPIKHLEMGSSGVGGNKSWELGREQIIAILQQTAARVPTDEILGAQKFNIPLKFPLPKWGIFGPQFSIFGRKFSDKKNLRRGKRPPARVPCH